MSSMLAKRVFNYPSLLCQGLIESSKVLTVKYHEKVGAFWKYLLYHLQTQLKKQKPILKVIDHYEKPRNVGSLNKNDENVGTGLVGAPACGDVMKLQVILYFKFCY